MGSLPQDSNRAGPKALEQQAKFTGCTPKFEGN
jgi:hypothetical protein